KSIRAPLAGTPLSAVNLVMSDQPVQRRSAVDQPLSGRRIFPRRRPIEAPPAQTRRHERGAIIMNNRVTRSSGSQGQVKDPVNRVHHCDEVLLQALVTAAALVALSDGQVDAAERDELVDFVDRQGFVPTFSRREIAEAFANRVRQLKERDSANVIVESLNPLVGQSLSSIVVRTAERVAAADRHIHAGEVRALELIRLIMMQLPAQRSLRAM